MRGTLTLSNWRGVTEESLAPYIAVVGDMELSPDDSTAYEDTRRPKPVCLSTARPPLPSI